MSMESHLEELNKRHSNLEQQIKSAGMHPSQNPLEIAALKRKKLHLKDQIHRLSVEEVHH
ncbi:MAG: DUF465 domain-containing protein [Hyphomicrobiales bacterium]